ncbi:MAG: PKD domain-containing protein [Candidatus Thermoplasmatota archaeon]|nr:PKD domain-containing protein [Candidatus Thermoplasmatota archaeon]
MKIINCYKYLLALFLATSFIAPSGISTDITSLSTQKEITDKQVEYIDLTVNEAWDFLSTTSNGIQLPIDVRIDDEWTSSRIDTPFPEYPRHFEKDHIVDEEGFQQFLELYDGNDIIVYCKSGGRSATSASIITSRGFNGTVYNMLGGLTDWKEEELPFKSGNTEPSIPEKPLGPGVCNVGVIYEFSTQTMDPDDDPVRYGWDFNGDEYVDKWTDYTPSSTSSIIEYGFVSTGPYNISVLAEDLVGSQTGFSDKLTVIGNMPPSEPMIDGSIQGESGISYEYEIVSTDAQGSEISYFIDWGDGTTEGWTRTLPSGESLFVSHTWQEKDTYVIKAKAKDEYEGESDWSTLEVKMPKIHVHPWLMQMFEQNLNFKHIILSFF